LSNDDVFAVLAYILNMGDIVDSNFTLTDQNIAEVQARMPNRNGMTFFSGMWEVKGKPDIRDVACMKNCPGDGRIVSSLPVSALGANGNPADQTRLIGETAGLNIAANGEKVAQAATAASPIPSAASAVGSTDVPGLLSSNGCVACHATNNKIVGPAFNAVRDRYKGDAGAAAHLSAKIKAGGSGVWGSVPMPPQPNMKDTDVTAIVHWILDNNR
jgi:cytochrome c